MTLTFGRRVGAVAAGAGVFFGAAVVAAVIAAMMLVDHRTISDDPYAGVRAVVWVALLVEAAGAFAAAALGARVAGKGGADRTTARRLGVAGPIAVILLLEVLRIAGGGARPVVDVMRLTVVAAALVGAALVARGRRATSLL